MDRESMSKVDRELTVFWLFCGPELNPTGQQKMYVIYIYMPKSYFLYHFFAFWRVSFCTTFFENIIFTAATSKSRVRNCTTGELVLYHFWGHFLPPKSGTASGFRGGTVCNSCFALCFPIFGTIWPFFWEKKDWLKAKWDRWYSF